MPNDTLILIPAYEPDDQLIPLVEKLVEMDFSVLVVDDGSGSKYSDIFNKVKEKAILLTHERNKGKGQALKFGFSYAQIHQDEYKYVITCDSDGQHSPSDIKRVDDEMRKRRRITFGVRSFKGNVPHRSKVGNNMSKFSRTLITKNYVQDDQCGLRGYPIVFMSDLLAIPGNRYEYEMNVITILQLKCMPIRQVEIETIYINNNAASHFSPNADTFRIQRTIFTHSLVGIVGFLITIGLFPVLSMIMKHTNWIESSALFGTTYFLGFTVYFGIMCFVYPTRFMGQRAGKEMEFFATKAIIASGFFYVFVQICNFPQLAAFALSLLIVIFINFVLAFFTMRRPVRRK